MYGQFFSDFSTYLTLTGFSIYQSEPTPSYWWLQAAALESLE
jgi:hypothetical protein